MDTPADGSLYSRGLTTNLYVYFLLRGLLLCMKDGVGLAHTSHR